MLSFSFRRTPLGALFGRDTAALPLDLLRIFIGCLSFFYFFNTWRETADFSAPDGLIDHALVQEIFPFTRLGLFQPGIPTATLQLVYLSAAAASSAIIFGWRVKFFAAFQFLAAVSAFRWNFLVAYVEDAIMHLLLLWLLLLPVGRTLRLQEWLRDGRTAWARWITTRVPGTAVGAFLCNLALIYLVAGLWKWTSPMWRDGTALFAVLRLPIAHAPEFWQLEHLSLLKVLTWSALVLEPILPLMLLLPRGHWLKWLLLAGMAGFHLGIVATMKIPFANLACLGAGVVIFREEIMGWLKREPSATKRLRLSSGFRGKFSVAFVIVLALAMVRYVPSVAEEKPRHYNAEKMAIDPRAGGGLGAFHEKLYSALWCVGVAQEYQLFNWIDVRNHRVNYEVFEVIGDVRRPIEPAEIFPDTNHSAILQCYLHDLNWFKIPPARNAELKRSLALRFAQRYCRTHEVRGTIVVISSLERITVANPRLLERPPAVLFSFARQDDRVTLQPAPGDPPSSRVAQADPARF